MKSSKLYAYSCFALLPVILGTIIGFLALDYYKEQYAYFKLDELALGTENDSSFAKVNGVPIHCVDLSDIPSCLKGYQESSSHRLVVWFGNSQIHAINQKSPSDETAVPLVHHAIKDAGGYFIALSQPNGNLQEHYLLFEYLMTQAPVDTIVLPLVFDDMRELGVRDSLLEILSEPGVPDRLSRTGFGRSLLANFNEEQGAGDDFSGLRGSVQKDVESRLSSLLESESDLWESRASIRGNMLKHLYRFRNWALGIKTTSIRKKIPARYNKNMAALKAMMDVTLRSGVHVLAYISPLRDDVKMPYKQSEYEAFKADVKSVVEGHPNAVFVNLEGLVPAELWGERGTGQIDFMHFQAGGHRLLGKALSKILVESLSGGEENDI